MADVSITTRIDGIASVQSGLQGLADKAASLKGVFGALSAVVGVGFFVNAIKQTIDLGDSLKDMSQITGVSVEQLSKMRFIAETSGTSLGQVTFAAKMLARQMLEAADGTGQAADIFGALGINVSDASGELRDSGTVLLEVGKKLSAMTNATERSAAATTLFGRSGEQLIPFFNSIEEGSKIFDAFGLTISSDFADSADSLDDNLVTFKFLFEQVTIAIANVLLPALIDLQVWLLSTAKSGDTFQTVVSGIGYSIKIVVSVIDILITGLKQVGTFLGGFGAAFVALLRGDFAIAAEISKQTFKDIATIGSTSVDRITASWVGGTEKQVKAIEKTATVASASAAKIAAANAKALSEYNKKNSEVLERVMKNHEDAANELKKINDAQLDYEIRINKKTLDDKMRSIKAELRGVQRGTEEEIQLKNQLTDVITRQADEAIRRIQEQTNTTQTEALRQLSIELDKYQSMGEAGVEAAERIKEAIYGITFAKEESDKKIKDSDKSMWQVLQEGFITWRDVGLSVTRAFVSNFGTAFADVVSGNKSFEDAMDALWENIKMMFLKMVGEMIAQWLIFKLLVETGVAAKFGFSLPGMATTAAGSAGAGATGAGAAGATGAGAAGAAGAGAAGAGTTAGAGTAGAGASSALVALPFAAIIALGLAGQAASAKERAAFNAGLAEIPGAAEAKVHFGEQLSLLNRAYMKATGSDFPAFPTVGALPIPLLPYTPENMIANDRMLTTWMEEIKGKGVVKGWSHGGSDVFTKPTMLMVGERGPERVSVDAMASPLRNGQGAAIYLNGPAIFDDISMARFTQNLAAEMGKWK